MCSVPHHDWVLAEFPDVSNLLSQHSEFLKVDEAVHLCLIAVKQERQVFLDDREERDKGRGGGSLKLTVLGHVVERIHVVH